jgi:hypothetical protein
MTKRMQIRIMAAFVLVLLFIGGIFGYGKWATSANPLPSSNDTIKGVLYTTSERLAIFEVRWKKDIKASTAKNKDNFLVEHVIPRKGKWLTATDGKKCTISFVQHVTDKFDPKGRVTQISTIITPKPENGDYFRVRARNLEFKEGGKMDHVEYGVAQVTNYANFTKK